MLFRQIIHEDLGCASYLVADRESGVAVVVDPQWDVEPYRRLARLHGVRIGHVLETHNHADHVSGHGRLARSTGATIHIHELAGAEYEHEPFADGWRLELGDLTIEAMHTPGHRPEHTCFLLRDASRGGTPWAVLGGDSLFIGDVARPDLAVEPREGAADMFRSLHERLLTLGDEVEVWPGHLGGSLCGGSGDRPQDLLDDRLRAPPQRGAGDRRRGGVRRADGRLARRQTAQRRADRRPQPRAAGRELRHAGGADPTRGRDSGRQRRRHHRRAHQRAVRRGPHRRRAQHLRLRHRLRDQGLAGGPGRGRDHRRRRLRRRRAPRRRAAGRGRAARARLPRGRDDRLAHGGAARAQDRADRSRTSWPSGSAARAAAGPRRPQRRRVRGRAHPRLPSHPLRRPRGPVRRAAARPRRSRRSAAAASAAASLPRSCSARASTRSSTSARGSASGVPAATPWRAANPRPALLSLIKTG